MLPWLNRKVRAPKLCRYWVLHFKTPSLYSSVSPINHFQIPYIEVSDEPGFSDYKYRKFCNCNLSLNKTYLPI